MVSFVHYYKFLLAKSAFILVCLQPRSKNTVNILIKNMLDAFIGGVFYWAIGWGLAYGAGEMCGDKYVYACACKRFLELHQWKSGKFIFFAFWLLSFWRVNTSMKVLQQIKSQSHLSLSIKHFWCDKNPTHDLGICVWYMAVSMFLKSLIILALANCPTFLF